MSDDRVDEMMAQLGVDQLGPLSLDLAIRPEGAAPLLATLAEESGLDAMFAPSDPSAACQLALDLVASPPNPVRAGLAHGVVVALHDYYGPTVNLAARLVSVASPSAIVVSESVHDATAAQFAFDPFETGPLRGFPDVTTAFLVEGLRA